MVIVEKKASGISLIETIRDIDKQRWLMYVSPSKSKVERTEQQAVKFEQGKVWLPKEAPWLTPGDELKRLNGLGGLVLDLRLMRHC